MKRPLLQVALLYVGGILIACLISLPPLLLLASSLSLVALTLGWARARLVGLCALIVLTGWTNHTLRTAIVSPHDLRRTLAKLMDKAGAPLAQISATLGHSSIRTTQIYLGIELELCDGKAGVDMVAILPPVEDQ